MIFVTGLWDIGRGDIDDWKRSFKTYTDRLEELLSTGLQFVVYGDLVIQDVVAKYDNSTFVHYPKEKFYTEFPYFKQIDAIRSSAKWYDQPTAQWLKHSPQARLPLYTPIQLSKLFLIHQTVAAHPESSRIYWIDAGITQTHNPNLLRTLPQRLQKYNKFVFLSHYYIDNTEIHGFVREGVHKYCKKTFVDRIMKGFFFGGNIDRMAEIMELYERVLIDSLAERYLSGADETYHTILVNQRPDLFDQVIIPHCFDTTNSL